MTVLPENKESSFTTIPAWLVWLLTVFFLAYGLGCYPILDNNEGLYAEIPREMLASGDWHHWIIPHLNGLAYMEKPPLLYWLTALSFAVFGEHEWAARLVPALSALSCVAMLMWFGRQIGRVAASRLAALMFISGLGVMAMSRTLMFDMLLTAFLSAALMYGYLFSVSRDKKNLCRSLAMLALALLAKGFVAIILFAAVTFVYTVLLSTSLHDFWMRFKAWFDPKAIAIFLLIAMPWHIAATLTEPIFAWFYFINEHVLRFLGKREPHDYYAGAWWYYLPRMLIYLFPWSFFLPLLLIRARQQTPRALHVFLASAWIMPVLFFSLSSAKANYYLVVVMPLAALQLAIALEDRLTVARSWSRALVGLTLSLMFAAIAWWVHKQASGEMANLQIFGYGAIQFLTLLMTSLSLASLVASFIVWWNKRIGIIPYIVLPAFLLVAAIGILQAMAGQTSTLPMVRDLQSSSGSREVFLFRVFEHQSSLPFYLKRPVRVVESRSSDLFWGNKLHKNNIVISDTFFDKLIAQQQVSLIVLDEDLASFQEKKYADKFQNIKKIGRSTVFMN
ncbi:glycosyltransferase family 39 protein [Undibacterium sp. TS12]|uniref:glycosyltransferase family 39 protein n=1 Tax=Undibacterium sp. TS12 TaxID=2908202 RepID=UPI001F4C9B95|nr:glycosyltransferase family 39 protein [Undibacterium sp. TS12]MCH8621694.1 glycosyltransferase family 39 protein [Undibacterium sp. TS12]